MRPRGRALQPAQRGQAREGVAAVGMQHGQRLAHGGHAAFGTGQRQSRVGAVLAPAGQHPSLPMELGLHDLLGPGGAPARVHHLPSLSQAYSRVVVRGAKHEGHAAASARAQQHGAGACLCQLQQHAAVQPGLQAVDDAAVDELQRHRAATGTVFVERERVAVGADFQVGAIQQQGGHDGGAAGQPI